MRMRRSDECASTQVGAAMICMSAAHSAIIPAGKARPISNGSLIADCPFHETGQHRLQLYPAAAVRFSSASVAGNAGRSPRTRTVPIPCARRADASLNHHPHLHGVSLVSPRIKSGVRRRPGSSPRLRGGPSRHRVSAHSSPYPRIKSGVRGTGVTIPHALSPPSGGRTSSGCRRDC